MRVKLAVKELSNRLRQLSSVIDSKATIPVYGYVRLSVDGADTTLTGHSHKATLEVSIKTYETDGDVEMLLPARLLQEMIASQKEQYLTLEQVSDTQVNLVAGKYRAQLTTLPPDAFQNPEEEGWEDRATLGLATLRTLIDRVIFVVPSDDKFKVSTALLDSTGKEIRLVATDGHCLALASQDCDAGKFQLKLPSTALDLLGGVLEGAEVTISEAEQAFRFKTALEVLTVRKTAGDFPPYERIMPKDHVTQLRLDSGAFNSAIDCAIPLAEFDEKTKNAILLFSAGKSSLLVTASRSGSGLVNDDVAITSEGPDIDFVLSGTLLKPFLDKVSGELVINCKDSNKAIDFQADFTKPDPKADAAGFQSHCNYRFVIMPRAKVAAASAK